MNPAALSDCCAARVELIEHVPTCTECGAQCLTWIPAAEAEEGEG